MTYGIFPNGDIVPLTPKRVNRGLKYYEENSDTLIFENFDSPSILKIKVGRYVKTNQILTLLAFSVKQDKKIQLLECESPDKLYEVDKLLQITDSVDET